MKIPTKFEESQRKLAELNQSILEARCRLANALKTRDMAKRNLNSAEVETNNARVALDKLKARLKEELEQDPPTDTPESLARDIRDLQSAANVGSTNQGKASTHR